MAEEDIGQPNVGGIHEDLHIDELTVGVIPEDLHVDEPNGNLISENSFIDEPIMSCNPEDSHTDEANVGGIPEDSHVNEHSVVNIHEDQHIEEPDAGDIPKDQSLQTQEFENDSGRDEARRWPGWPGENVFRMLVPVQKVGSIIGRKGEYIKKITEDTKARIKILDGPPGTSERAVMVFAKEEPDAPIPPAMDGLLMVHKKIVDVDGDSAITATGAGGTVITRLLVADTQAGSLIGKQGSTIKSIQDASNSIIRVLGAENLPLFALPGDSVVEIQGEPAGVHKAVELIASHLRKFLVDRSIIGVFEMQMQRPNVRTNQNMPPPQSWGPPQGFPMNAGSRSGIASDHQYMQPPRQLDNYYPPPDLPAMDKQLRQVPPMYGRDASMGGHSSNMQAQQSMVTKVTHHMQVPLLYADAVIGTSGANISYIRRASGATIAVQETRGVPGEMTVEINGSASQIQTAQQLIQNSMVEAASSAQNPSGVPVSQGYNAYPAHGPVYASPPSDATGHAGHIPAGDYGSVYGTNYGYLGADI